MPPSFPPQYESVIFLFLAHPYDVGDALLLERHAHAALLRAKPVWACVWQPAASGTDREHCMHACWAGPLDWPAARSLPSC